jgi:hypothetical protein
LYFILSHLHSYFSFPEKEERKKVVNTHLDHGSSLSERIKKRKRSFANHKPDDAVDSASYEGNGIKTQVTCNPQHIQHLKPFLH